MTVSFQKIAALLILAICALDADVSDPAQIQKILDAAKTGSNPDGSKSTGQRVDLAAGNIWLKQPLLMTSGQSLVGKGSAVTTIHGDVRLVSYLGHHYVLSPRIEGVSIAGNIIRDDSAWWIDDLRTSDVRISGGRVFLDKENYHCSLDLNFSNITGQCLRIDGQNNTLKIRAGGHVAATTKPVALVEIHGSATFAPGTLIETDATFPQVACFDWQGYRGHIVTAGLVWWEPHGLAFSNTGSPIPVTSAILSNTDFVGESLSGCWPGHPWQVSGGATYHSVLPFDLANIVWADAK